MYLYNYHIKKSCFTYLRWIIIFILFFSQQFSFSQSCGTGLTGWYYDDFNASTFGLYTPKGNQIDATINFTWASGSVPYTGMTADGLWSIRWNGFVVPKYSQVYTFFSNHDDGVKVWVNNSLIINQEGTCCTEHSGTTAALTAGNFYPIMIEYNNTSGGGNVNLSWQSTSQVKEIVPQSQLYPYNKGCTNGLNVQFFDDAMVGGTGPLGNQSGVGYLSTLINNCYSDYWANGSNVPGVGFPANSSFTSGDYWGVSYQGFITVPVTGAYTFYRCADNGFRLYINDMTTQINFGGDYWDATKWNNAGTATSVPVQFTAGIKYPIRIDFADATGGASYYLHWSYSGQSEQSIPSTYLYTNNICTCVLTADAGNDQIVCKNASFTLGGSPTAISGTGVYTYAWASNPAGFSSAIANPTVTPTVTTTYTVTVNDGSTTATDNIVLTVPSAGTDQTICGGGSATLTGSGGTIYNWSTGGATTSITVSPTVNSTYTVTVSNVWAYTCSDDVAVNVKSVSPNATICSGSTTTLSASGGSAYIWSTGSVASSFTVNPTTSTTYSVTIDNGTAGSCTNTVAITVYAPSTAPTTISGNTLVCSAGSSTTLTASGGSDGTGATMNWYTGSCGPVFIQEWFSQPYTTDQTTVNSVSGGILDVTSTGGDPKILMYPNLGSWDPTVYKYIQIRYKVVTGTANQVEIYYCNPGNSNSPSQAYMTNATLISDNAWHIVNIDMTTAGTNTGSNTTPVANWQSHGNLTGWRFDYCTTNSGVRVQIDYIALASSQAVGQGSSITVSPTTATTYYVLRSDFCNITSCAQTTVTISTLAASAGITNNFCNGSTITLGGSPTASGGSTPYTYAWASNPAGYSATTSNPTAAPTVNTTYTVTVTDASGCTATSSVAETISAYPSANAGSSQTVCSGNSFTLTGTIASGGKSPYVYSWVSNPPGFTSSSQNPSTTTNVVTTYTVSITDACSNTASSNVVISVYPTLSTTAQVSVSSICNGGSVTLSANTTNGKTPYTFSWVSNPSGFTSNQQYPSASPTVNTTYTVSVTDACSNNTVTSSVAVGVYSMIISAGNPQTVCSGTVSLGGSPTATGGKTPYTYLWSTGATPNNIANPTANIAAPTTYTVTVTDACSTSLTSSVFINIGASPTAPTITAGSTTICAGGTGTTLSVSSGSAYAWAASTGTVPLAVQTPTVNPTASTTYTVTVTNGCTASNSISITYDKPILTLSSSATGVCEGVSLTLSASLSGSSSGTTPPYTYSWSSNPSGFSSNQANPTVSPTVTTIYYATLTDANGCTNTNAVTRTITVRSLSNPNTTICSGNSLTLTANGGSITSNYSWSISSCNPGSGSRTQCLVSPTVTTTYTVTVNYSSTNTSSICIDNVVISVPPIIAQANPSTICNGNTSQLSVSTGGCSYTYSWSNSLGTNVTANVTPTSITTYTVYVTDLATPANTVAAPVTVAVNANPTITVGGGTILCRGSTKNLSASGADSYLWSNGLGNTDVVTVSPTINATYTVTGTNTSSGCFNTSNAIIDVDSVYTTSTSCNGNSASFTLIPVGLGTDYNYVWSDGLGNGTSVIVNCTSPKTYYVTGTDGLCTRKTSFAFTPGTPCSLLLPVTFLYFRYECSNSNINNLIWATATETNNDHFTIEVSTNGTEFTELKQIKGAGNSKEIKYYYEEIHSEVHQTMYYRLKQTDYNGEFTYSHVVSTDKDCMKNQSGLYYTLAPNPSTSDNIRLTIISPVEQKISVSCFDMTGQNVYEKIIPVDENQPFSQLLPLNQLSPGVYMVVLANSYRKYVEKIIIK